MLSSPSTPLTSNSTPVTQANNNEIVALPILPPSAHPSLETIYLEGNPVEKTLATAYRRKIMLEMPQVKQIDAVFVKQS